MPSVSALVSTSPIKRQIAELRLCEPSEVVPLQAPFWRRPTRTSVRAFIINFPKDIHSRLCEPLGRGGNPGLNVRATSVRSIVRVVAGPIVPAAEIILQDLESWLRWTTMMSHGAPQSAAPNSLAIILMNLFHNVVLRQVTAILLRKIRGQKVTICQPG